MQQSTSRSEIARNQTDYPEDEIELIDLLWIIWKWKYLIIGGTVFCAAAALVISMLMPKIYRIETVVRPGILSIGAEGENVYIDTPENIKALIETGIFDNEILDSLNNDGMEIIPKDIKFSITLPKNSSTIMVSYDSPHIEQGIQILSLLGSLLTGEYRDLVKYYQNEIDRDINIKKAKIQNVNALKQSNESNIKNIEKRIRELETEIAFINENTAGLNNERKKLLSKSIDESSTLSALLYSNTIQQNLQLANDYKDEISNYKLRKETELQKISKHENELQKLLAEIENLEFKKNSIQNIQIIRKPARSALPIKPKKGLIFLSATIIALFLLLFLSFFLEYLHKNKVQNAADDRSRY
jgi:LPS O-antigen subunit length determinant protein (WzzB/FepE family)